MTKLKNNVEDLNTLIKEGKLMEAFEKYYSDDVSIQVDGNVPTTGKEQNRKREKGNHSGISVPASTALQ